MFDRVQSIRFCKETSLSFKFRVSVKEVFHYDVNLIIDNLFPAVFIFCVIHIFFSFGLSCMKFLLQKELSNLS